jgi:hypothetical protein
VSHRIADSRRKLRDLVGDVVFADEYKLGAVDDVAQNIGACAGHRSRLRIETQFATNRAKSFVERGRRRLLLLGIRRVEENTKDRQHHTCGETKAHQPLLKIACDG